MKYTYYEVKRSKGRIAVARFTLLEHARLFVEQLPAGDWDIVEVTRRSL